jgi:hypothetical protein
MHKISQPEWAYLQHWQDEYLQTDLRDMFNIPGDHTSGRMAKFADAVWLGQRSGPYSTCVSDHLHGYFDRSMRELMEEIEHCKMHEKVEKEAIDEANKLLLDIRGGIM